MTPFSPGPDGMAAQTVLALFASVQDGISGCGGTLARYAAAGADIHVLLLNTDRQDTPSALVSPELETALSLLGISRAGLAVWELPLDIRAGIKAGTGFELPEKLIRRINRIQPDICLVPWPGKQPPDRDDIPCWFIRAIPGISKEIRAAFYENTPMPSTNRLVDITPVLKAKREALSAGGIKRLGLNVYRASHLGQGVEAAEAFRLFAPNEFRTLPVLMAADLQYLPEPLPTADPVSIVIRTRNRPGAVIQAVQSVLSQTWPVMEIVLINDGKGRIQLPENARIPVHVHMPEKDGNRSRAANLGIKYARGALVGFLDDDDLFSPFHVEMLARELMRNPWCSAAYSGVVADEGGRRTELPCPDFDLDALLRENYLPIHSVLVRRDVLEAVDGFDEALDMFEDWDLWIRLALAGYGFSAVRAWTAVYRIHSHGTLRQAPFGSPKDMDMRWKVIKKHEQAIQNQLESRGPWGRVRSAARKLIFKAAKDLLS